MGKKVKTDPDQRLAVFAAEVDRQRAENARRQGNMHSRAGVLVAAAGVVTGLHLDHPTLWLLIPATFALATAGVGLPVLVTRSRNEPAAKQDTLSGLDAFTTFQVRRTVVEDNLTALEEGRDLLETKARLVNVGYVLLAATWVAQIVVALVTGMRS